MKDLHTTDTEPSLQNAPDIEAPQASNGKRSLDTVSQDDQLPAKKRRSSSPQISEPDNLSTWFPASYVAPNTAECHPFALIILNVPIEHDYFPDLHEKGMSL